ncbi:N-acetylmuramoyl-L-alanine amidase [Bacillus sp. FJAT-45037]|uniref:N-acetylmuramoyl-L-alanine amidase n=1 Tax=Bacillus sp. FJAT-45037 TaxID=2011007 RepID=UPI000C23C2C0|nr:N-acetylmuramoyl-L-alanine amidase [Bacillus sp. FJAT-45037]
MAKIFLDPGHGGRDPGAIGNGLQEKNIVLMIARRIRDIMLEEYDGVEVRMSRDTDVFVELSERTRLANVWRADYFISIHVNAGGGTGFESFIHPSRSSRTVQNQSILHSEVLNQIKAVNRGKKNANFAVLRNTSMPAILTESLFIDNVADANRLRRVDFLESIARGHVEGIARIFNLRKKVVSPPPPAQTIYRVQVGAFKVRGNAERVIEQLRRDGYEAFVLTDGDLNKVQAGAFTQRDNAEKFRNELRQKGYDATLMT